MFLPVENRHSESSRWSRLVATPILLAAVAAVGGCSMPKAMRVETANHPTHKDEYVRFRTTYYFRVYDYCADVPGAPVRVLANALYRFRMTGKAHSLTSAMRFEAGTLPKDVIDPVDAGEEQGDKQEHVNQAVHGNYVSRLSTDTPVCMSRSRRLS